VSLYIRKDAIAKRASFLYVPGTQREAQTFSCSVRLVDCNVAPPYTAVIPQVMVDIVIVNTKRDFSLL
jgi:hypothetical protein